MRIHEIANVLEPVRDKLRARWAAEREPPVREVLLRIEKAAYDVRVASLTEAGEWNEVPEWLEKTLKTLVRDAQYDSLDLLLSAGFAAANETHFFLKPLIAGDPTVDYD